jgi:DNA transformation protein
MPLSPGFSDYVLELVSGLGRVQAKRMFGGAGLFRDGVMFGLLLNDVVYFRVDDALAADLKEQGSAPWVYTRNGKPREMGYWRMPETAADDPDEAVAIARRAYAAAVARKAEGAAPKSRKPAAGQRAAPAKAKVKARAGK